MRIIYVGNMLGVRRVGMKKSPQSKRKKKKNIKTLDITEFLKTEKENV